ncbi:MAG: hypothetical protein L0H84_09245 [Pseudonocardia sp.]|nr:hypothetical protein [Pseudonocardia sp.]
MSALEDQIAAASADTRDRIARALPGAEDVKPATSHSAWSEATLDRLCAPDVPRCRHLRRRPVQPSYVLVWEGHWRCVGCADEDARRQHDAMRDGTWRSTLGTVEERTCDRCRREVGPDLLTPTILRDHMLVVVAALCPRCVRLMQCEGGQLLEPAAQTPSTP